MSDLSIAALALGGALFPVYLLVVLFPARARAAIEAFPRHRWSAYALTAIDLFWVCYVILHADLGRFEFLKPAVYLAGPLAFILLVLFLDELLASRALGGLLLLVANPLLNAARWHDSPSRLVLTVAVYIMVIKGMMLVMSPYRFRQGARLWMRSDGSMRAGGVTGLVFVAVLIVLALTAYRVP